MIDIWVCSHEFLVYIWVCSPWISSLSLQCSSSCTISSFRCFSNLPCFWSFHFSRVYRSWYGEAIFKRGRAWKCASSWLRCKTSCATLGCLCSLPHNPCLSPNWWASPLMTPSLPILSRCDALCCTVLHCVALCCTVLQCVAVDAHHHWWFYLYP